ncbi:hydroxyacylglutathione hydrolase [Endozoicomonadaceae bacterium StTr2]
MIEITPIPAFNDNYIWLLTRTDNPNNSDDSTAWVVDPGDGQAVLQTLQQRGLSLGGILITHHHADHTGGIQTLLQHYQVPVVGPNNPAIKLISQTVGQDDEISILGSCFKVYSVPGHTLDHIAYFTDELVDSPALFCGDTLFAGGCGRLFEGSAEQMLNSMQKLAALPNNTRVFCAHEYTEANLRFAIAVEPENEILQQRIKDVALLRSNNKPSVPSTLLTEKNTNPFLRTAEPDVIAAAKMRDADISSEEANIFKVIRNWKDCF